VHCEFMITSARRVDKLTGRLQDSEDLVASHVLDLTDTLRISQDDTNLGRSQTLASKLADLVADLFGGGLQPRRRGTLVRQSRCRHTLTWSVHTTHF
jgi:hypothetical protein